MYRAVYLGIWLVFIAFFCCKSEVDSQENDQLILKRALAGPPESLDIHCTTGTYEKQIIEDLFTPLLQYSIDGKVVAGVAMEWDISKDGKVYTFYLRDSQWSNGDPVTADDFVYTFRRAIDPNYGYVNNTVVQPFMNADKIISGEEKDITKLGVRAIDQKTLEITLKEPIPCFLELLASHAFPVHRKSIQQYGESWVAPDKMINNGPFRLSTCVENSYIELIKNEVFYEASSVKLDKVRYEIVQDPFAAKLDKVNYEIIKDPLVQVRKFKDGELDVTTKLGTEEYILAKKEMPENILEEPTLGTIFLMIQQEDNGNEALKNPNIIKALSLAIDREVLINLAMNGLGKPAFGVVPEGVNNYKVPSIKPELSDQAAREKLAQEIYKKEMGDKNLTVRVLYPTMPDKMKIGPVIASMWKKVLNVEVILEGIDWPVWVRAARSHRFEISLRNWSVESNDPYTALLMFVTKDANNMPAYSNLKYDKMFKKANNTMDLKERAKKLRAAELLLIEDGVVIPLSYNRHAILIKKNIKGWGTNQLYKRPSRYVYKEL